jgi:hypothetical protein
VEPAGEEPRESPRSALLPGPASQRYAEYASTNPLQPPQCSHSPVAKGLRKRKCDDVSSQAHCSVRRQLAFG